MNAELKSKQMIIHRTLCMLTFVEFVSFVENYRLQFGDIINLITTRVTFSQYRMWLASCHDFEICKFTNERQFLIGKTYFLHLLMIIPRA